MIFSELKLFELLKAKLGEEEATTFIQSLQARIKLEERKIEYVIEKELKESLLTKEEAKILLPSKEEVAKLDARMSRSLLYFTIAQSILIAAVLITYFLRATGH